MQPKDAMELEKMLEAAIHFRKPCCIRYPCGEAISLDYGAPVLLGRSEIIRRGKDICLIALGDRVSTAMAVAQKLTNYSPTIINARFIKPLDGAMLLACAREHKRIYVLEDHVRTGGFGSGIAEFFTQKGVAVDLHIFAWPDCFIPHASHNSDLEKIFHFTVDDFVLKILHDFNQ
jgi:1-deoxy-D-xylulose-5-phosphate synthase